MCWVKLCDPTWQVAPVVLRRVSTSYSTTSFGHSFKKFLTSALGALVIMPLQIYLPLLNYLALTLTFISDRETWCELVAACVDPLSHFNF